MAVPRKENEEPPFTIKVTPTSDNGLSRIGGLGTGMMEVITLEHNGHEIGTVNSMDYDADITYIYDHRSTVSHMRRGNETVTLHLTFKDGSIGEFTIPVHLITIEIITEKGIKENEKFKHTPSLGGKHRIEIP